MNTAFVRDTTSISIAYQAARVRKEANNAGQDQFLAEKKFYMALERHGGHIETRVRRAAHSREPVGSWNIAIAIPKNAVEKKFEDHESGTLVHYAQFGQSVAGELAGGVRQKGGWVNFFLHHSDPMQFVGTVVVCTATLVQKVMEDGSRYLYVDLVPALDDVVPDRRLTVMHKKEEVEIQDDFIAFSTPSYGGVIIISLAGSKVTTTDKKMVTDGGVELAKESAELAWYMRRGWKAQSYSKEKIFIIKGDRKKLIDRPQSKPRCS